MLICDLIKRCIIIFRMWDLDNEDNYILSLDGHNSYDPNENVMCISYSAEKG
jgi:hypothetical protein